ncbi:hypothetical protein QN277_003725 [Acacia crassicarpa]|uniref:Uncharacterized protein n=1 Tax=Acacia crassicarpa TaxID=499986 RepID=A0AAE1MFV4_9FABA|nr:hypothetical protein QN277_003725 [Acacia crassicarpa]
MAEQVQYFDPTRHLHPGLDLHGGSDPYFTEPTGGGGGGVGQGKRLNGESGGHAFGTSGVDVAGGYKHETDLAAGVEKLKRAIIVREEGSVGVSDGGVLGEGETDGAVRDGEGGKLDSADGDLGVLRLEDCEVNDENGDKKENQEDGGDETRGKVGACRRRWPLSVRLGHGRKRKMERDS